jgi:hypothetical protein
MYVQITRTSGRKIDNKQVAPFGAEQISELNSVFEIPHLRAAAVFLNIQCKCTFLLSLNTSH